MKQQMTIRIPPELKDRIQQEADKRGDSFNQTVIRLINIGLDQ